MNKIGWNECPARALGPGYQRCKIEISCDQYFENKQVVLQNGFLLQLSEA
jgi:hypothetical protein